MVSLRDAENWINQYGLTYPVLADQNVEVVPLFLPYWGIYILPHSCIVDDEQTMQYTHDCWGYQAQLDEMILEIEAMLIPEIGLSAQSIEFDSTEIGQTAECVVYIDNIRTGILSVISAETGIGTDFTVDFTPGEIFAVDDSMSITISFTPVSSGSLQDSVLIISDAANQPEIWIAVTGSGYCHITVIMICNKVAFCLYY